MSAKSFTQEQIYSGIRFFWKEELGCDSSFDLDSRIDRHLRVDRLSDLIGLHEQHDFADIIDGLECLFGFSCSEEEWVSYFNLSPENVSLEEWEQIFAPGFTFRRLTQFIQEKASLIALEPITLLGKPCLTAGIFRGLEQLIRQISPNTKKFAPSTPIHECLKGTRLRTFWNRLRWIVEDQLPPAPRITLHSRAVWQSLFLKILLGVVIAVWRGDLSGIIAGFMTTLVLFIPVGIIVAIINDRLNPLPEEIETFADLVRVLAAIILDQQNEAASCSTP